MNATALATPAASKNKIGPYAGSNSSAPSSGRGTPSTLLLRLQSHEAFESIEERDQRKKQKFDLRQQRVDQEQQRIDLEKQRVANEQQRVAFEHEQRTQQMEMNALMMQFLVDCVRKRPETNGDSSIYI
jgi:hypothetical protein